MTHARRMADYRYAFDAIDQSMPGMFVVHTITGTMHVVVNDSAGESVVRRFRPQYSSEFIGDADWLPVEYQGIRIGEETSFHFIRSEVYGEDPAYTGTWRRTPRVTQISLYDGFPEFLDTDTFGRPRGMPTSTSKEPS